MPNPIYKFRCCCEQFYFSLLFLAGFQSFAESQSIGENDKVFWTHLGIFSPRNSNAKIRNVKKKKHREWPFQSFKLFVVVRKRFNQAAHFKGFQGLFQAGITARRPIIPVILRKFKGIKSFEQKRKSVRARVCFHLVFMTN